MELFEEIRREYDTGKGPNAGVARKIRVHRRLVREALGSAVPREKAVAPRAKPRLEPVAAFIEAHKLAFRYFGGVFHWLRYDSLGSAVKRVLRGSRREEAARFVAFPPHWRFESVSFLSGGQGAHEKGRVEVEVDDFRRIHWVSVPEAGDLAAPNQHLLRACQQDEHRLIAGREQTVEAAMLLGRSHLLPLAELGAESLFQVAAERAEHAAVILTTNLPFSEWMQVVPNARLCNALLVRITDRAHIIETGTESYRFRRTIETRRRVAS